MIIESSYLLTIHCYRYVSVQGSYTHESVGWTYRILGFLVGQPINVAEQNCTQLPLYWYPGYNGTGQCHYTTQNLSQAYSPAFIEDSKHFSQLL